MLEDGTPYEHFQGFRWLYIGLKQLEIEWKPGAVRSKRVNHKQKTKLFLAQATKILLETACLYLAKGCCFAKPENMNVVKHAVKRELQNADYKFFYTRSLS